MVMLIKSLETSKIHSLRSLNQHLFSTVPLPPSVARANREMDRWLSQEIKMRIDGRSQPPAEEKRLVPEICGLYDSKRVTCKHDFI